MKVHQLIAELEARNPESIVYLLDADGDRLRVGKVYNIDDKKTPVEKQDILLMEDF